MAAERTLYTPEDARKRRRLAPIAAAVAAATVAETAQGMYNDGCPEDSSVSLVEHAADQARMANLKVKLKINFYTMIKLRKNISCCKKSEIKRYGTCIFQVQITNLIANILGEECLANLGFPDTDILDIINSVLESARLKPYSLEDTEADYKEDITKYEIIP